MIVLIAAFLGLFPGKWSGISRFPKSQNSQEMRISSSLHRSFMNYFFFESIFFIGNNGAKIVLVFISEFEQNCTYSKNNLLAEKEQLNNNLRDIFKYTLRYFPGKWSRVKYLISQLELRYILKIAHCLAQQMKWIFSQTTYLCCLATKPGQSMVVCQLGKNIYVRPASIVIKN